MLESRHSTASIPSHHDIYPRGEAPWELEQASMEKILGDAAEPSTEYHASWDALPRPRIGNLTTYELMMFYDGDKRPLTMRLEQIPQGPQRDAVIMLLQEDLGNAIKDLDFALDSIEFLPERGDDVARYRDRISYLNGVHDDLYSGFSGE